MLWLLALAGAGFVASAAGEPVVSPPEASSSVHRSQDDEGNYKFGYSIDDGWGSSNGRWEVGDANGNKRGGYTITEADGRRRYVEYVADKQGFRVLVNTNEPGTAPSHSGASITKPAETKDEAEDEALLQKLGENHDRGPSYGEAQLTSLTESYEPKTHLEVHNDARYQAYNEVDGHSSQAEIHTGASAPIEKSAFAKYALEALAASKSGSVTLQQPQSVPVSPVPVRDVPGYFSSSNKIDLKSVYGDHALNNAADIEKGVKAVGSKTPPIVNSGWSSKKEFYRDYLKRKYANQERYSAHPKQITVEHVEPIDPKTLLSYDRRFLPIVYSNLKQKLLADNDETAVESFVAKPDPIRSRSSKFVRGNYAHSPRLDQIVSSEPVFPVSLDHARYPVTHSSESIRFSTKGQIPAHHYGLQHSSELHAYNNHKQYSDDQVNLKEAYPVNLKATASAVNLKYAFAKRTGFAPRKYDEVGKNQPLMSTSLKNKSEDTPRETVPRKGGSGRDIYSYY